MLIIEIGLFIFKVLKMEKEEKPKRKSAETYDMFREAGYQLYNTRENLRMMVSDLSQQIKVKKNLLIERSNDINSQQKELEAIYDEIYELINLRNNIKNEFDIVNTTIFELDKCYFYKKYREAKQEEKV